MRCVCCNKELSDFEATRKDTQGKYLDMCNTCFKESGLIYTLPVIEREDLAEVNDTFDEDSDNYEE